MTDDKQRGEIITFYSYKGGTGRSMSLANVACTLTKKSIGDKGILMIDWDLEAPGLHRFFQDNFKKLNSKYRMPGEDLDKKSGLIELFMAFDELTPTGEPLSFEETEIRAHQCINKISLEDYILQTDIPNLNLLKAGSFNPSYSSRANTFNWEGLFRRSPLLIRTFAERLSEQYRYVLIDSRTGITDISGICTMLMPEKLVVVFTPNRQSLTGLNDLALRATKYRRESDDLRPLLIFPLPSRIETSEPARKEKWRFGNEIERIEGYQPLFEKLFKEVYDLKECDLTTYFDEVMIQHMPPYAYGEEIASLIERKDALSLARSYMVFTQKLTQTDAPWASQATPSVEEYTSAKEREKEAIKSANELSSQVMLATRRAKIYGVIAGLLLIVTLSVWVWMNYIKPIEPVRRVNGAVFSPDGKEIFSWSRSGALLIWDTQTREQIRAENLQDTLVDGVILSPSGKEILFWSSDGYLRLWDIQTAKKIRTEMHPDTLVGGAIFSPNGGEILSWSLRGTLELWDVQTGEKIIEAMSLGNLVDGAVFSPDGKKILSWSRDGTLSLWDEKSMRQITKVMKYDARVNGAIFSPNEKEIISWSRDGVLLFCDAQTGMQLRVLKLAADALMNEAVFSPDGRKILSWSYGGYGAFQLWGVQTGEKIKEMISYDIWINGAVFSPDGKKILCWSLEGTLQLWDVKTGRLLSVM